MKQKKNSSLINCLRKSFQILKDEIKKKNQFKKLSKKPNKKR